MAASREEELRSNGELHRFVTDLSRRRGDEKILTLWFTATTLHQNFYENWLPSDAVEIAIKNVKKFIEKVREGLKSSNDD